MHQAASLRAARPERDRAIVPLLVGIAVAGRWRTARQRARQHAVVQRRDAARTWLSATMSPQVREWLGEFILMLSRYIDEARISEERNF